MNTSSHPARRRDWLTFDRSDRFGLAVLLGLVVVIAGQALVMGPIVAWARGEPLEVPFVSPIRVPELDAAGLDYGVGGYDLRLATPTTAQRVLDVVPGVLLLLLILFACWLMLRLMRDIGRGEPFAPRNVTRLRLLAAVLALGVPVAFFARLSCTGAILGGVDLGTLAPAARMDIPWVPIVAGTCLALLAEAFKAGATLREDVEGLV